MSALKTAAVQSAEPGRYPDPGLEALLQMLRLEKVEEDHGDGLSLLVSVAAGGSAVLAHQAVQAVARHDGGALQ